MDLLKRIFSSRKWVAGIVGFLLPIANEKLGWGLSQEAVISAVVALAAAIFGEAYKDGKALEGTTPK